MGAACAVGKPGEGGLTSAGATRGGASAAAFAGLAGLPWNTGSLAVRLPNKS
jgi:hypothetical protein